MSALECLACEYKNPGGAKYCAECGAQLNLKLCRHCEAINERTWERCYSCGAAFPGEKAAQQFSAHPAEAKDRIANFVPIMGKRSMRMGTLGAGALLGGLALAALASLVYYLYWQPSQSPIAIDLVPSTSKQPNAAVSPAASITSAARAAEVSAAKSKESVPPPSASAQRSSAANRVPNHSNSERTKKKQRSPVMTSDSAVNTSSQADDARTVAHAPSVEKPATARAPAPNDGWGASAKAPVTVGGPRYPVSPNDFHFTAPPP